MSSFGGTVKLTGESEYRAALKDITSNLKVLNSELKVITSQYDKNDASVQNLSQQNEVLNKKVDEQQNKVNLLADALAKSKEETGENSEKTKSWQIQLNNAQADLNKMTNELGKNSAELEKAKQSQEKFGNSTKTTINSIKDLAAEMLKGVAGASSFGETLKNDLSVRVDDLKDKVKTGANNIKEFGSTIIDNVKHPQKLGDTIKDKLLSVADKLQKSTDENTESLDEFGKEAEESGKSALKLGDIIKANLISDAIKSGIKGLANAIKSVGSAFVDIGKQAMASYAEYEQLVGGVETLFGESADIVKGYANDAYKTAGLSANEYMETVTSFSASLISSLGGDTAAAGEVANRAIIDMSDNANKMGTDMESLQNAYQGFAKQNYTMLDNLKLGYGGTKEEMQRLIQEASQMTDVQKELGVTIDANDMSFANIANAISVVQKNMGIAGTTSAEAAGTMSGSISAMRASWQNLITGMADDNADFEQLVNNLVVSVVGENGEGGVLNNILPRLEIVLDGIVEAVVSLTEKLLPQVMQMAVDLITTLITGIDSNLPALLKSAVTIMNTLVKGITDLLPKLIPVALSIIKTVCDSILKNLPSIIKMGVEMLTSLIKGISNTLPELVPLMVETVVLVAETLLDNLDLVIDAGIDLILALAEGVLDALPQLIDKVPVIIEKLISAITYNLPQILAMGVRLIVELGVGLVSAIPQLVGKIPSIISAIVKGLGAGVSSMANIGKNLLQGLWEGMGSLTDWLWSKVQGMLGSLTSKIKSFFGIASPSKLFKNEIGTNLALGVGEGFTDTMKNVTNDMTNAIPTEFDTNISTKVNSVSGASATSNFDMTVLAFKKALAEVKVFMNDREMGTFVTDTVERCVFA